VSKNDSEISTLANITAIARRVPAPLSPTGHSRMTPRADVHHQPGYDNPVIRACDLSSSPVT
jgi:hypothetical protein